MPHFGDLIPKLSTVIDLQYGKLKNKKKMKARQHMTIFGLLVMSKFQSKIAQNHVKLMACVSPPHFILTYIKYRKTLQPFNL